MTDFNLPPLTQESVLYVDATPNEEYPLRILRAYRANCDCRWASTSNNALDAVYELMNTVCGERAAILDRAIAKLEEK